MKFLSTPLNGRSTLRPAYVMVYGWVGGKNAHVCLARFYHLWGFYEGTKSPQNRVKQNGQT